MLYKNNLNIVYESETQAIADDIQKLLFTLITVHVDKMVSQRFFKILESVHVLVSK